MVRSNVDVKVFFAVFIGVILAVALLVPAADTIFTSTNTFNVTNETVTAPTLNQNLTLTGRSVFGTVSVFNNTNNNGSVVPSSNFTIQTGLVNGLSRVVYTNLDADWNGVSVNVSYDFVPEGNVPGAGGTLLTLVVLFGSLGVLIFVVVKVMREGSMKNFMERFGKK